VSHESLVIGHEKKGFKQLEVWKLSMRLVNDIYDATETFPKNQQFGLVQQIQRSAVSVPSNIAEGCLRAGKKEFIQFLYISRGSLAELETQWILAYSRKYIKMEHYKIVCAKIETIQKMLIKLIQSQKPMTDDL
jgi:four helix bundle protein